MLRSHLLQALLSLLVLVPGCGTSIGNPPKDDDSGSYGLAGFKVNNNDGNEFVSTTEKATVTLSVIQLVLKDVSFYSGLKPQSPTFAGTYLVDLIGGTIDPPVDLTRIAANSYSDVSFSLVPANKGQFATLPDSDELINNSLHIKGTLKLQGVTRTFDYAAPLAKDINIKGLLPSGSTNAIVAGKTQNLVIGLNIAEWFNDLSQDDLDDSTVVVTQILKALESTTTLEVQDQ